MSEGEGGGIVYGARDPVSGQRWAHVPGAMVRGHPKGRLNPALYLVVLFFAAMAAWRLVLWAGAFGGVWMLAEVVIFALAALALFLRAPPGVWLGITGSAMVVIDFAAGIKALWGAQPWSLAEAIVALVVGFYLLTGARPNFIYRHRFLTAEAGTED